MRFAVVTWAGRDCVYQCLEAIRPQVDQVVLIDNRDQPDTWHDIQEQSSPVSFLCDHEHPPNLSRMWNRGIQWANDLAGYRHATTWKIAILNDDAIVPPGWFDAVESMMDLYGAAAGCSGPKENIYHVAEPVPVLLRMTGWAFVLRGEKGLRADERIRWWAGDDDLAWRAAAAGGMAMTDRVPVPDNLYPNGSFTPQLHEQAARDMEHFVEKWGQRPW